MQISYLGSVIHRDWWQAGQSLEYLDESDIEYSKQFIRKIDSLSYQVAQSDISVDMLSKYDKKVIEEIVEKFSQKSSQELVDLTHEYPEWKQYESEFSNQTIKHADISIDELFSVIKDDPLGVDEEHTKHSKLVFLGYE